MAQKRNNVRFRTSPTITENSTNDHSTPSIRLLKKREVDRRCQKQLRERNKSRVAYLESLVVDLAHKDESGCVPKLLEQLSELERDRDGLAKTLRDIESLVSARVASRSEGIGSDVDIQIAMGASGQPLSIAQSILPAPSLSEYQITTNPSKPAFGGQTEQKRSLVMDKVNSAPVVSASCEPDTYAIPIAASRARTNSAQNVASNGSMTISDVETKDISSVVATPMNPREIFGFPLSQNPTSNKQQLSQFALCNEFMTRRYANRGQVSKGTENDTYDVALRAVLMGWEAAEQVGPISETWRALRGVDESKFVTLQSVEHLASLIIVYVLMSEHCGSCGATKRETPLWYFRRWVGLLAITTFTILMGARPYQSLSRTYAADFLVWPGLRERFAYAPARYSADHFWNTFNTNLKILWPYELRDCYTVNKETGTMDISPLFDDRIRDLRCWTMLPDFFHQYPELLGDIPCSNEIPISLATQPDTQMARLRYGKSQNPISPDDPHAKSQQQPYKDQTLHMVNSYEISVPTMFETNVAQPFMTWPGIPGPGKTCEVGTVQEMYNTAFWSA